MKKYSVCKVYRNCFVGATIVFLSDTMEDANLYAELMSRNSEEGYTFYVCSFCADE